MERDIVSCHKELQRLIHIVEEDETNREALAGVRETFLALFDMIKMIMISRQERYYGVFLMNFDLKIEFTCYFDAGVNMDTMPFRMIVNPLLIGLKTLPEMIYIFCHEIEHIVLNHPTDAIKYNSQKSPETAYRLNIAMDASINDRLTEESRKKEFNIITEPKTAITSAYLQEEYKVSLKPLQAFDYYFERIGTMVKGRGLPQGIILGDPDDKGEIITEPKRKGRVWIPYWTAGDDPDECAGIIRSFVSDVYDGMPDSVRENLPNHQKELLDKLLKPPAMPWQQLLKKLIGTIPYGHRKTCLRLNRRQPERYDMSGSMSDRILKLVVAIDTSMSMSRETLNNIMTELFAIIGLRLCEVTVVECDFEIRRVYQARSVDEILYDVEGRGGTSFVPVIEYVNADKYFRDAILIYFTDGMGDDFIPRPLTLRTMWVLYDRQCQLSLDNPYGEVLFMEP